MDLGQAAWRICYHRYVRRRDQMGELERICEMCPLHGGREMCPYPHRRLKAFYYLDLWF